MKPHEETWRATLLACGRSPEKTTAGVVRLDPDAEHGYSAMLEGAESIPRGEVEAEMESAAYARARLAAQAPAMARWMADVLLDPHANWDARKRLRSEGLTILRDAGVIG